MRELWRLLAELEITDVAPEPDRRLRAHLGLDSTETVELETELRGRFGLTIDLWDDHDFTVGEIAALIDGAATAGR